MCGVWVWVGECGREKKGEGEAPRHSLMHCLLICLFSSQAVPSLSSAIFCIFCFPTAYRQGLRHDADSGELQQQSDCHGAGGHGVGHRALPVLGMCRSGVRQQHDAGAS